MQESDAVEIETGAGAPLGSVIWLHGLGADGHDFEPIVPELRLPAEIPLRFVFPHAPVRPVTLNVMAAAIAIGGDVDVLVAGSGCDGAAQEAANIAGQRRR